MGSENILSKIQHTTITGFDDFIPQIPYILICGIIIMVVYLMSLNGARRYKKRTGIRPEHLQIRNIIDKLWLRVEFIFICASLDFVTVTFIPFPLCSLVLTIGYCGVGGYDIIKLMSDEMKSDDKEALVAAKEIATSKGVSGVLDTLIRLFSKGK